MTKVTGKFDVPRMLVLDVPVSLVTLASAVALVTKWANESTAHMVFVRDVASLMLATENRVLLDLHHDASLVLADGAPLAWIGKFRGYGAILERIPGADMVEAICKASLVTGQSHYFYGGKPGVAESMKNQLCSKYPGLKVVGTFSPPMRDIRHDFLFSDDGKTELDAIKRCDPDFIWIGISSPKQEYWMAKAAPIIGRGVFLGVGAAFDFHSGRVKRAPRLMRNNGLEWLHRLLTEPRRLWKRYLVLAPKFVIRALFHRPLSR